MRRPIREHFDRMQEESCHLLTGQFLIAPVGWFPHADPQGAMAIHFVSLGEREAEPVVYAEGALLFSTN